MKELRKLNFYILLSGTAYHPEIHQGRIINNLRIVIPDTIIILMTLQVGSTDFGERFRFNNMQFLRSCPGRLAPEENQPYHTKKKKWD